MSYLPLLDSVPERRIADTSRQAYERLLPTLTKRQFLVLRGLFDFLDLVGGGDATGGELTEFLRERKQVRDVNGCRPRLCELSDLGLIESGKARRCRAYGSMAHPYWPTIPRAAMERAIKALEGK